MNVLINQFYVTRLLVGAHYDFHSDVSGYITEATAEALHVETLHDDYKSLLLTQLQVINQNQNVAFSQELADLDDARDRWIGQLFRAVDSAADSPDEDRSEAGLLVQRSISPYRGIAGNEYTKETAELTALVSVLGSDALHDAIDEIFLGPIIDKMERANWAFDRKYNERITVEATRRRFDTNAVNNRKMIDEVYKEIVQIVNAYSITAPTEAITNFINKVNARVDQCKRIIARLQPGGTGNEKRLRKLQQAADKMGKALARMETAKAEYEKRTREYAKAKKEYEDLLEEP